MKPRVILIAAALAGAAILLLMPKRDDAARSGDGDVSQPGGSTAQAAADLDGSAGRSRSPEPEPKAQSREIVPHAGGTAAALAREIVRMDSVEQDLRARRAAAVAAGASATTIAALDEHLLRIGARGRSARLRQASTEGPRRGR